jgi:hypothetical protein
MNGMQESEKLAFVLRQREGCNRKSEAMKVFGVPMNITDERP